jgi:hypothetical protein
VQEPSSNQDSLTPQTLGCKEWSLQPTGLVFPKEFLKLIKVEHIAFVNSIFKRLEKEADDIYEKDPTKGRGRGPKWIHLDT